VLKKYVYKTDELTDDELFNAKVSFGLIDIEEIE